MSDEPNDTARPQPARQQPGFQSAQDSLGAFCPHGPVDIAGATSGPLAGQTMAVKDLYDIAGYRTGFGNPTWLQTHDQASATASAVTRLLEAGAAMRGKTICDELCYSLNGENIHYGTPQNVNAPGRIPGGSSSGSAVAVAGGLVDFALGSDTGGSVRLPASYCGIYGLRPTQDRIPADGVVPLAASFDVPGWFARDPELMRAVGAVLLPGFAAAKVPDKLLILDDAFEIAGAEVTAALLPALDNLKALAASSQHVTIGRSRIEQFADDFRVLQGLEIWATHGDWITREQPQFDPAIAERLKWTSQLDHEGAKAAQQRRRDWQNEAADLLPDGAVLALPVAPGAAPLKGQPAATLEQYRLKLTHLLCLAGLAGLPQMSLPLATIDECPLALGLAAGPGKDESLLALAAAMAMASARQASQPL